MTNPFTVGLVESEKEFCNRTQEIQDLLGHTRNGNKVVLFSPRRYGKSSLVKLVQKKLAREGLATVYVDLFPVSSKEDLVTRLAYAFFKGLGKGADPRPFLAKAKGLFGRLRPTVSMTAEGVSFSVDVDPRTKPPLLLDDLMEGVGRYVEKNKVRVSVVLDEFQEITDLPESKEIEGILRSHIQSQRKVSYFFVGSRRRVLQEMFSLKARPFYKSAFLYPLKKIAEDKFVPFIEGRFQETGKECPERLASEIYGRVDGYPYYVQKLASLVWDGTERKVTQEIVHSSQNSLIRMETPDFEAYWSGLTGGQRNLLKAIASSPTANLYSKDYLKKFGLSLGGTQKALRVLLERDLIEKGEAGYALTDPVMRGWLCGQLQPSWSPWFRFK